MEAYEKLGAFYLGKKYLLAEGKLTDELILYDSKDLNTHAVIVGMTGSGKTGLGVSLLEEALIDNIPVIAIDPKGDLTNLKLNFPELKPTDFLPWLSERDAATKGLTLPQFADNQAKLWKKGLAQWGQGPERLSRLKDAAQVAVYTPGSNAGLTVNLLGGFEVPPPAVLDDDELLRETIKTLASGVLTLVGVDADPITSREHILIANIFEHYWTAGQRLDLAGLIQSITNPPFTRLGVMTLESIFPEKDRFALAMRINNLLASPGFETWLSGDPLDISKLLYTAGGKPRASVFCISHLNDQERMFFVSLLLNKVLGWMRGQPGTSSLKAVLYMDEVLGFMPPLGNPPSKDPLLRLLKQARAFGLGLVLATQNPVDLDYKGLSNAGTWFIGRLQTERDKARLLDGLEGVSPEMGLEGGIEETLASLGKRVFLLHNVHERRPEVFHVRWAMSYLAGPMTRDQITRLEAETKAGQSADAPAAVGAAEAGGAFNEPPMLPPEIDVGYLTASGAGAGLTYIPATWGQVSIGYRNARYGIDHQVTATLAAPWEEDQNAPMWEDAFEIGDHAGDLQAAPLDGAIFSELPAAAAQAKAYGKWSKAYLSWVRQNRPLVLLRSPLFKAVSTPDEDEDQFRGRLAHAARERRDLAVEKLRRKYQSKFNTMENKMLRAQQALEREKEQAQASKLDTLVSIGTAVLGAFLGRKAVSKGSVSKVGTAIGKAGRARKQSMDVDRAKQTIAAVQEQMADLEANLQADIDALEAKWDPANEELKEIVIKPKSTQMALNRFCLAWLPYRKSASGTQGPDW